MTTVQAISISNFKDDAGDSISVKVEVGSWVTLNPEERGYYAKDAKRHGSTSNADAYKGRVVGFKASNSITQIRLEHAYSYRHLSLDPSTPCQLPAACNYLYLSGIEDWVHSKSILDIIDVQHAEIGELCRGSRTHQELLQNGIFFYNARYIPSANQSGLVHGTIEAIPLPNFDDPSWPLPDMASTEAFRNKLRSDFQNSMKPTIGSRSTHIHWFMPIGIMVDLFKVAPECMHKTPTMFIFKNLTDELLSSLMDSGWDVKVTIGLDAIKCVLDRKTLQFRYHIGRSILYANFQYNRKRKQNGTLWEDIDLSESTEMVRLNYSIGDCQQEIEVGKNWSIASVRQEIQIAMGNAGPNNFVIWIEDQGKKRKVSRRNEEKKTAEDVLPPKILQIIPDE